MWPNHPFSQRIKETKRAAGRWGGGGGPKKIEKEQLGKIGAEIIIK